MSLADLELNERILTKAKEEFMREGYENASLRRICKNAGVTTGVIYNRYKGKEELFEALVSDAIGAFRAFAKQKMTDVTEMSDTELKASFTLTPDYIRNWFAFLNQHHDSFVLLFLKSTGSRYESFRHDFTETVDRETFHYYQELVRRGLAREGLMSKDIHIFSLAYWDIMLEPFLHDYSEADIERFSQVAYRYIQWTSVILKDEEPKPNGKCD